jgi:hypothetical protein
MTATRRLAAILAADVAGYSGLLTEAVSPLCAGPAAADALIGENQTRRRRTRGGSQVHPIVPIDDRDHGHDHDNR